MTRAHDENLMKRAIELALRGWGKTSPNPLVGAMVVKGGRVVGEGYHRRAGTPHAEVHALKEAGKRARGADLYVTLEPCCHHGRTPPCTERIIDAGVKRVVIGMHDPNPEVNGRGIRELKEAGIKVDVGILRHACQEINRPYETYVTQKRPFVILKAAVTLDGKIATADGESKWITGDACRDYVHRLRSGVDAIVVGGGTVRRDDPRLSIRVKGKKERAGRVVLVDEKLNVPVESKLIKRKPGELIIATTDVAPSAHVDRMKSFGHDVIVCRRNGNGYVALDHLMNELYRRGVTSILVEGGGEVFSDFLSEGLVDHVIACVAPKFIGGSGKDMLPGISIKGINHALQLKDVTVKSFDDDIVIEGSPCLPEL